MLITSPSLHGENMKKGLTVKVDERFGGFEKAMRQFKKKVENDGRIKEYRDRERYTTPSEQKQIDRKRAINRHKKKLRDERKSLERYR